MLIDENPNAEVVGMVHDRDPGTDRHGHAFYYDRRTARTESAMRRKLPVDVIIEPFIAPPDGAEGGPRTGRFAMAHAARYFLREHPDQTATGKASYGDDEMYASPTFDWRADVDALKAYEGIDPGRPARMTLIERLSQRVLSGDLTARDAHRRHSKVYLAKGPSYWEGFERKADKWATTDAAKAEQKAMEARRHLALATQEHADRMAAEEAARDEARAEQQEAAERAERERIAAQARAEMLAREEAKRRMPEHREHTEAEAKERELRDLIDMIAMWDEARGSCTARAAHGVEAADELGLTGDSYLCDGGLTHLAAVLVYAERTQELLFDDPAEVDLDEVLPDVRDAIRDHRRDISSVGRMLAGPELHATEGDEDAFEKALRLRQDYSGNPDLVTLPQPRTDIKKAWRDQLVAALTTCSGQRKRPPPSPGNGL